MRDMEKVHEALEHAAQTIRTADALLVSAGAGMGVDSGLPDVRGTQALEVISYAGKVGSVF
jgi:hypothetical protein